MFWNRISSSYFWKVRLWYKICKSCINLAGGIRLRFSSVFQAMRSWASAHRGKWGQLTPWKMDEKSKSENMQKEQFSMFMFYFESNLGRQV